ncbi:sensor histidine kinase [Streptomyces sp. ADMS]|uniref:sensor histidine kinase n=1 Tax=Streptomyces sp. ADMS TaxID=3071415 RepID=UPI00296E4A86|nr:sensor histidine kinase [Streptomyces sp. ADMS]MDW4907262.1 sensor histidine kinase [Streptomyces sp. ADMS]
MISSLQRQPPSRPRPVGRPGPVDAAVAAAVFACSFPGIVVTLPGGPELPWGPGTALTGVSCVALLWHRCHPRATVVMTVLCATAMAGIGHVLSVLLLGPLMVALHSLALRTDRKTANSFTFGGIALLVSTALIVGPAGEPLILKLVGPAAWLVLPTSLGTATRLRGAYLEAVQARAEHAERTREEEARRRVAEERMRIARDLHDVVAHHLVLAKLQAGAVARQLPARPDEAARIVTDLTGTTASALRELKATVGLLRHSDHPDLPTGTTTPGLAQLPELAASFQHAGLAVAVTVVGEPRPLSAGVDLTAYRIAQEALTNVTKHAAARSAEVRLTYSATGVVLAVTDEGPGKRPAGPSSSPRPSGGYGLIGMRERAHSVGGRFRAEHRGQGGFGVVTELPLQAEQPEQAEQAKQAGL